MGWIVDPYGGWSVGEAARTEEEEEECLFK